MALAHQPVSTLFSLDIFPRYWDLEIPRWFCCSFCLMLVCMLLGPHRGLPSRSDSGSGLRPIFFPEKPCLVRFHFFFFSRVFWIWWWAHISKNGLVKELNTSPVDPLKTTGLPRAPRNRQRCFYLCLRGREKTPWRLSNIEPEPWHAWDKTRWPKNCIWRDLWDFWDGYGCIMSLYVFHNAFILSNKSEDEHQWQTEMPPAEPTKPEHDRSI